MFTEETTRNANKIYPSTFRSKINGTFFLGTKDEFGPLQPLVLNFISFTNNLIFKKMITIYKILI